MIKKIDNHVVEYSYTYPSYFLNNLVILYPNIFDTSNLIVNYIYDITTSFNNYGSANYKLLNIDIGDNFPESYLFFQTNKDVIISSINNEITPHVDTSDNYRIFIINKLYDKFIKYIQTQVETDTTLNFVSYFKQKYISINPDYHKIRVYTFGNAPATIGSYYDKNVSYDYTSLYSNMITYCKDITNDNLLFIPNIVDSTNPFIITNKELSLFDPNDSYVLYDDTLGTDVSIQIYDTTYPYNCISYQIINNNINYHDSTEHLSISFKQVYAKPKKKTIPILNLNNTSGKVIFPNKFKIIKTNINDFIINVKGLPNFNYVIEVNLKRKLLNREKFKIYDIKTGELFKYYFFDGDYILYIETTNNIEYPDKIIRVTTIDGYDKDDSIFMFFDDFTSLDSNKQNYNLVTISNSIAFIDRNNSDSYLYSKNPIDGTNIMVEFKYKSYSSNPYRNRLHISSTIGGGNPTGYDIGIFDNNQIYYNGQTGKYLPSYTNQYKIRQYNHNGYKFNIYTYGNKNLIFKGNKLDYSGSTPYIVIKGSESNNSKFYIDYVFAKKCVYPEPTVKIYTESDISSISELSGICENYYTYNKIIYVYPKKENNFHKYYRDITITNDGSDLSDYQIEIRFNIEDLIKNQKVRPDLKDFLIIDPDTSSYLPVFIDNIDSTVASIQTKISSLQQQKIIRLYYGNYFYTNNIRNGNDIFDFFDDFDSTIINSSIWDIVNTGFSIYNSNLIGTDTSGNIKSKQRFNPPFILETKFYRINLATNGTTIISLANSSSDCIGYLLAPTEYYRNNGTQTSLTNNIGMNKHTLAKLEVKNSSEVNLIVSDYLSNEIYHNILNISNSVSNEYIQVGTRNDGGYLGEKYSIYQDWIRVRKYTSNNINVIIGDETSLITIDSTSIYPNFIPINTSSDFNVNSNTIPIAIHNSIETVPYFIDEAINTYIGKIIPIYIKACSCDPIIISDDLSSDINNDSDITYVFSIPEFTNISNGYFIQNLDNIELDKAKIISEIISSLDVIPVVLLKPYRNLNLNILESPINTIYIKDNSLNTFKISNLFYQLLIKSTDYNATKVYIGATI